MLTLKRSDEIWTKDNQRLGHPHRLYHRTKEVDPAEQLYGSYLRVISYDIGDDFYIPTEIIVDRSNGRVLLSVSLKAILDNTWDRMPEFIPLGDADIEELPGRPFDV